MDHTVRKLQKLLEWIFVMIDLHGLIDTLINFIKNLFCRAADCPDFALRRLGWHCLQCRPRPKLAQNL